MRQQISRELYSYWNVMRGARAAPERTRLDPGAIRPILADTFLLEVDSDGEFPFRVAGARVNALWRRELKETSFIDLWRKEDRHSVQAALMAVVNGVAPVVGGARRRAPRDSRLALASPAASFRENAFARAGRNVAFPARRMDWSDERRPARIPLDAGCRRARGLHIQTAASGALPAAARRLQ
jgi:hypothetical protein